MAAGLSTTIFVVCVFYMTVVDAKVVPEDLNRVVDKMESLMLRLEKFVDKLKVVKAGPTQLGGPALPVIFDRAAPATKPWSQLYMITLLGKKYHINNELRLSYNEALDWCQIRGLQLVSIETEAENNALAGVVTGFDRDSFIWTSGNDLDNLFAFKWKSTGKPFTFTRFHPGDPNNFGGNEKCVLAGRWTNGGEFGWLDVSCVDWRLKVVCEEP